MTIERKKTLSVLISLLFLALALTGVQIASAGGGGGDVAMEMISIQAESQAVDTDGDGRPETFSADYTIYADGTAEGYINLDTDYRIDIEKGTFSIDDDGDLTVGVQGTNTEHEIGHWLGLRHEHGAVASCPCLQGKPCDHTHDFILIDIVGASANTYEVSLMVTAP